MPPPSPVGYTEADAERRTPEIDKPGDEREPWERDRARILHSAAFRRLQRKTQVFAPAEGDFYRTRLTHSIEVSQIAKGIALRVGANPTLCEAASLAHDIGHPPFGHAGERVLNSCMADAGGFEGNAQNLRVVATLEVKSQAYTGLNLTRATLDALLKYKSPHSVGAAKFYYDEDAALVRWVCQGAPSGETSFECQIMDWADDVAYSVHDVEDGLWAGLIDQRRLEDRRVSQAILIAAAPAAEADLEAVRAELLAIVGVPAGRDRDAARKSWSSQAIYELVHSAQAECHQPGGEPRYARRLTVEPRLRAKSRILKAIAEYLVFSNRRVASLQPRALRVIETLFRELIQRPDLVPRPDAEATQARAVCDYIAGMTDDFALRLYGRLRR